jgi:hypothetical protein
MIDTTTSSQELEELEREHSERLAELQSQRAYINMLLRNTEQDILEIEAEKEIILRDLERAKKEERNKAAKYNGQEINERWKKITRKMTDANTYNWQLFRNNSQSSVLTDDLKNELREILTNLTRSYNSLSKLKKEFDSIADKYNNTSDFDQKERTQKELQVKITEFTDLEDTFNNLYLEFINKQQTRDFYDAYAQNEVEKKLEEIKIDTIEPLKLANSRENVDRVKFMIYIDDYIRAYRDGRDVPVPSFAILEKYYNKKTGLVKNEEFPAFFEMLTGISFEIFNQENEIKNDKVRQILTKHHIKSLNDKEKLALKTELTEEDLTKEEEKRPILSYLSVTEKEEEEIDQSKSGILKRSAKKIKTDLDYGTDPYLSRNPLYQKRAKEVHEAIYVKMLEKGQILSGLADLNNLTQVDSLRPELSEIVKGYVNGKVSQTKSAIKKKVKDTIDTKILGQGISTSGLRITTTIVDKARYLRRKKRKAKGLGKTLTRFIIKRIFDEIVGKIVDTAKSAIDLVKNTTAASRMSNYFRGTSFGQSIQKIGTATLDTTKAVAKMPGEFVRGLINKGDLAVKAIKANRFVIGAMDAGHVAKTALGKAPRGLIYSAGVSSIALSLGIPITGLLPIAIGGGLLGIGIETIDDLMHTPTFRPTSGLLRWIQSKGSALYRNPITGGFSNEIIQNNPQAAANLKNVGNAFGGRGARLFSAAKTGLSGAMFAAAIAGLIGINPVVAGVATFGAITAGKFALRTATGRSIYQGLMNNTYGNLLSRLAILPLQRMMLMVGTTQIMSNLIEDLVKTIKSGGTTGEFLSKNFSFKDKGVIDRFLTVNNYLGMYGYFTNYAFLTRMSVGRMMEYIIRGGEMSGIFGPSKYTGILNMIRAGWDGLMTTTSLSQLLSKIGLVIRGSFLPTLALAGSTLVGLGIAALLGINIGGIGATVGALAGGLIGMGIGALIATATGGFLTPLVLAFNAIGTTLGAWVGSLFDNAIDKIARNLFAVIGGISFLFTLIDMFQHKSMNLRRITMASLSLALTLPALAAVLDKASVQQSQSNSTLPTPTIVNAYYQQDSSQSNIQVINNSGYPVKTSEIKKLTNQIFSKTPEYVGMEKYIILKNDGESSIFINGNSLIINLSVVEKDPASVIDELIAKFSEENVQKTSLR